MSRNLPADFDTMRPIRNPQRMELTVGQTEGDLRGKDDKVIQAAADYVFRLGGGAVRVLPGTYAMRNALFLLKSNCFVGCPVEVLDQRAKAAR